MKPKCALEYQKGMGGVDLQDQMTALSNPEKGYRKIFFIFLICVFSTPSLCTTRSVERKEHRLQDQHCTATARECAAT
jgi:hypothetical protein